MSLKNRVGQKLPWRGQYPSPQQTQMTSLSMLADRNYFVSCCLVLDGVLPIPNNTEFYLMSPLTACVIYPTPLSAIIALYRTFRHCSLFQLQYYIRLWEHVAENNVRKNLLEQILRLVQNRRFLV